MDAKNSPWLKKPAEINRWTATVQTVHKTHSELCPSEKSNMCWYIQRNLVKVTVSI